MPSFLGAKGQPERYLAYFFVAPALILLLTFRLVPLISGFGLSLTDWNGIAEPVSVGIFLKRAQTFAELRPMRDWEALSFSLPRTVRHALIKRKVVEYHGRYFHIVNLRSADDIDDDIRGWLTEAYFASPE